LQIRRGWFVEFGAWNGKHLSNTFALLEDGWEGVAIEADTGRYRELVKTAAGVNGRLYALNAYVAPSGDSRLDELLKGTPAPTDLDLLSIDIDSCDYWVWDSLQMYSAKVVVIEINSAVPVGTECVPSADNSGGPGASFSSMLKLGHQKGYALVCHCGNMIFVERNLVGLLGLPSEELGQPDSLFVDAWTRRGLRRQKLAQTLQRMRLLSVLERARGVRGATRASPD
jgi:hypothetical protein